jgi:hypothetical protein
MARRGPSGLGTRCSAPGDLAGSVRPHGRAIASRRRLAARPAARIGTRRERAPGVEHGTRAGRPGRSARRLRRSQRHVAWRHCPRDSSWSWTPGRRSSRRRRGAGAAIGSLRLAVCKQGKPRRSHEGARPSNPSHHDPADRHATVLCSRDSRPTHSGPPNDSSEGACPDQGQLLLSSLKARPRHPATCVKYHECAQDVGIHNGLTIACG